MNFLARNDIMWGTDSNVTVYTSSDEILAEALQAAEASLYVE